MRVKVLAILFVFGSCLLVSRSAQADVVTFNSSSPGNNSTTRDNWLSAIGIAAAQFTVNFESGFSNLQNISGVSGLFSGGLVITDTGPGTPSIIVRSGNGVIGGSNPVGSFSITHDEAAFLELDFSASPVDYVAFQDIDQTGTSGVLTLVGGGTVNFSFEGTGGTGNSAEFFGLFRNDMPQITNVQLNASGDGRWGLDTIEYGPAAIPEPSSLFTLLTCAIGFSFRRKR